MKAISILSLKDPLGAGADREDIGTSTVIASDTVYIEAEYAGGSIGDANVYKKNDAGEWVWKVGVPTSNMKSYKLVEPPARSVQNGQPETQTPPAGGKAQAAK